MTTFTAENATEIRTGVSWDDYVKLRDSRESSGLRLTYHDGTLVIMSSEYIHESGAERLNIIVQSVAEVLDLDVAPTRTTTFRRKGTRPRKGSGKEPDLSFYFGANERSIRDKDSIDLDLDPPPDLAIEVDHTAASDYAFPIYVALGVPEVWRYDARERTLTFHRLTENAYRNVDQSVCLPVLTIDLVLQAMDAFHVGMRYYDWVRWVRGWARGLVTPHDDTERRP